MALCVMERLECMELTAGNSKVEILWRRIKGQTNCGCHLHSRLESTIDLPARTMMLINYTLRN